MLETPVISVPLDSTSRPVSPWNVPPRELSVPPRFPHTRAQLTAIARQYRTLDTYDDEDNDDSSPVTSALVARVATILDTEREDELKILLKDTFGPSIDEDEVSILLSAVPLP